MTMKIDMTTQILDLDGEPIPQSKDGPITTLRSVVEGALLAPMRGDENLAGAKKAELFLLVMRVHTEDECEMKAEEIVTIKDRVGKLYGPLVVGRAYAILDPDGK